MRVGAGAGVQGARRWRQGAGSGCRVPVLGAVSWLCAWLVAGAGWCQLAVCLPCGCLSDIILLGCAYFCTHKLIRATSYGAKRNQCIHIGVPTVMGS